MSLVTNQRYVAITGDSSSPSAQVEGWLDEATSILSDDLGRPLAFGSRIESLWPDRRGDLYPTTPLVLAVSQGRLIGGTVITGAASGDGEPVDVEVTGGFVERSANPAAANALPAQLERDLAWAAHALGHADGILASLPSGVVSASVGDVSVSFGAGTTSGSADDLRIRWSRTTRRWSFKAH